MEFICSNCKYIGKPAKKKRGSDKLALAAWLSFPLGLPYTLWRMVGKKDVCKQCRGDLLIPVESRLGKTMMAAEGLDILVKGKESEVKEEDIKV